MRTLIFSGLGIGFLIMAVALYALTLRKAKPTPAIPNKSQLREQVALAQETKKMRIASGITAVFGITLILLTFI